MYDPFEILEEVVAHVSVSIASRFDDQPAITYETMVYELDDYVPLLEVLLEAKMVEARKPFAKIVSEEKDEAVA